MDFHSARAFMLWDYNVSHRQVLFRSPRNDEFNTNIDVVFWGVDYLTAPTRLSSLHVAPATSAHVASVEQHLQHPVEFVRLFLIISGGIEFFVIADGSKVLENTLDIFDSSLVRFSQNRPASEYGNVLVHS